MIIPEKLKIGDKIGIVSTARKITLEELKAAILILESWGLEIVLGQNLFEENNQFSGTIEQRTADLQSMIDNDVIKAILCARGGYGTIQIVDKIDFSKITQSPKWIIGYSDITVLHSHLHNLGVTALELLPVHAFISEQFLTAKGLQNYWGYNTLNFFTPHKDYLVDDDINEFKRMVSELHKADIEVILDVVYNHTAEAGADGPIL